MLDKLLSKGPQKSQAPTLYIQSQAKEGTPAKETEKEKESEKEKEKEQDKDKEKEKEKEVKKILYDPEDDVWVIEEEGHSEGRKYALSLVESFYPVLYIASVLGLFPLIPYRQKDGSFVVKFKWKSYAAILFMVSFVCSVGTTFWILISLICITVNSPGHPETLRKSAVQSRAEEIYVYRRNVLTLVLIILKYLQLTICMTAVFLRKDFIAKQFVYWTEVVELLRLDVGKDLARKLYWKLLSMILFGITIIIMYAIRFSPGLSSCGSVFYVVLMRVGSARSFEYPSTAYMKHLYAIFLLYVLLANNIYVLWFFFNCKILENILTVWNNRFQYCLHKEIMGQQELQLAEQDVGTSHRTSRAQLFNDHLIIFNLLEGVNMQFEVIMESFYLTAMIMIVFETYAFVHAFFYVEYQQCGARQHDLIPILLFLCLQVYVYLKVTMAAAGVADETRNVLDIVRRKGMMSSSLDSELWFMLSMRLSFGGHEDIGIIGAGFFYITKAFLLGTISAMTSHFIIFYQFEIPFGQSEENEYPTNNETQSIRHLLEGINTPC